MRVRCLLAAVVVIVGSAGSAGAEPAPGTGRLPGIARPVAYRIDIVPDLDQLARADGDVEVDFAGRTAIDIDLVESSDTLTLNALGLRFASVAADGVPGSVTPDEPNETATLRFPARLAAGRHTLVMAYAGKIAPQARGLFYAVYDTAAGRRRMLTTHFEAPNARRMFPCWDEPAYKATFALSTVVPASFMAISNMPIAHEEPAGANRRVTFGTTPVMSTYLVVLSAGEMERISRTIAGVEVGVAVPSGRTAQARYALDGVAAQALPFYTDYFGVPYPLPKLDHVAVPGNMTGAMENWGAITYADNFLLFDPAMSSEGTRQEVFQTVTHEIAHQWVGNLVTMTWWDDLWLNEGFATWMEKKVADRFNPTWKIWVRAHTQKEWAMWQDALRTAHPVQQEVLDASQALSAFDNITYDKGAAFIRMLEAYLGEDTFREGMRAYMKAHAFGNATSGDLWAALSAASGQPVAEIAASFTEQPGTPLIKVASACIDGRTTATLHQERFSIRNPYAEHRVWRVPVTIGPVGGAARPILMGEVPQTIAFDGCGLVLKANVGDVGHYRVQYDDTGLRALAAAWPRLPGADRVNLLADAWAMVQADRAGIESFLDLTRHIADETELGVWENVIESFRAIDRLARGTPAHAPFRQYVVSLLRPSLARLGWDPRPQDGPQDLLLRSLAIKTLGRFGDESVIVEARRRFSAFLRDPAGLHPDLRDAVAAVVGYWADRDIFEALHRLGREAESTEEKRRYYIALATTADPALIAEAVRIAATDDRLPNGQVEWVFLQAALDNDDPVRLWQEVFAHRDALLERMSEGDRQYLLPDVAGVTADPAIATQMRWAPQSRISRGARAEADKSGERIELRAEMRERVVSTLETWSRNVVH